MGSGGLLCQDEWCVEEQGGDIEFNVFAFNTQPGVAIDNATGDSWPVDEASDRTEDQPDAHDGEAAYILNVNSMKFHLPNCANAARISDKNREEWTGSREDLIGLGYEPAGCCNP